MIILATYERDLTSGSVVKQLIAFGIPVLLANLLQACYSVVDMLIVGQFIGGVGLTAVSIGGMVINIISSFCIGFCTGGQVVVAQFFGAGEHKSVKRAIGALFTICLALAIVLPCISIPLSGGILNIMNTPAEAFAATKQYVVVCLVCLIFTLGYHGISSVLRGMGDSKMPLVFIVISTVLNVIFDLIAVGAMQMGVMGAALATVIAQGIAFLFALIYLLRQKEVFTFSRENFRFDPQVFSMIIKVGIPIAAQQTFLNVSAMFASSIINSYGLTYSSASGIGIKIENFAFLPHIAMSAAVSTVVGQNIGAGKPERAAQATRAGVLINLLIGVITVVIVQAFAPQIVSLFDNEPEIVAAGVEFMRVTCFAYVIGGTAVAFNGLSTGVGDAWFTMATVVATHLLLRIVACSVIHFVLHLPLFWVYVSYAVTPALSVVHSIIYCALGKWKNRSLVAEHT